MFLRFHAVLPVNLVFRQRSWVETKIKKFAKEKTVNALRGNLRESGKNLVKMDAISRNFVFS